MNVFTLCGAVSVALVKIQSLRNPLGYELDEAVRTSLHTSYILLSYGTGSQSSEVLTFSIILEQTGWDVAIHFNRAGSSMFKRLTQS